MKYILFIISYLMVAQCFAGPKAACTVSLAQLITGSEKEKNFSFTAVVNGKRKKIKGSIQNEAELRIRLPSQMPAEKLLTNLLKNYDYEIGGHDLANSGLPKGVKSLEVGFRLMPLKSDTETWHGSAFDPTPNFNGQFTKRINLRTEDLPSGDVTQLFALVGAQYEISDYYDTHKNYFQKQGIAIRIKAWYPYKSKAGQEFQSSGQSLFIKINRPNNNLVHERVELQIPISEELTLEDLDNVVREALKKQGIKVPHQFQLNHVVGIINQRLTVQLNYATATKRYNYTTDFAEEKVGFITFDSFITVDPKSDYSNLEASPDLFTKKGSHHQIEIEFTENGQAILKENPEAWDKVFKDFAKKVNGRLSKTPKYIEALKDLQ